MSQQAVAQQAKSALTAAPIREGVLQRQCDCGNHTIAESQCESCKKEAAMGYTLQRSAINPDGIDEVPPIVPEVLRSPGQPLDAATRAFFEPRFGHDFSRVRVHTNLNERESTLMNAKHATSENLMFHSSERSLPPIAGLQYHYPLNCSTRDAAWRSVFGKGSKDEEMSTLDDHEGEGDNADEMPDPSGEREEARIGTQGEVLTSVIEQKESSTPLEDDFGDWGLTLPERIDETVRAVRYGTKWKAELTELKGYYSKQTRLLPGVQEVTGPEGNTTSGNFCAQADQLDRLGLGRGIDWYMYAAVVAHEDVHAAHMGPTLADIAPEIKAAFSQVKVDDDAEKNEATALNEIQARSRYDRVKKRMLRKWIRKVTPLTKADHRGPAFAAEYEVVDPMIETICNHSRQENWGPCHVCHP